ncbi:hypothetical protein LINPERHAP2_LOCUS3627 [Linum perenne]
MVMWCWLTCVIVWLTCVSVWLTRQLGMGVRS